ncbi:MAG: hypothetical protein M3Q71_14110 [Chloroflexota bacterium]|nr:hypothetical protein [Chloroflexota bacterium]
MAVTDFDLSDLLAALKAGEMTDTIRTYLQREDTALTGPSGCAADAGTPERSGTAHIHLPSPPTRWAT